MRNNFTSKYVLALAVALAMPCFAGEADNSIYQEIFENDESGTPEIKYVKDLVILDAKLASYAQVSMEQLILDNLQKYEAATTLDTPVSQQVTDSAAAEADATLNDAKPIEVEHKPIEVEQPELVMEPIEDEPRLQLVSIFGTAPRLYSDVLINDARYRFTNGSTSTNDMGYSLDSIAPPCVALKRNDAPIELCLGK